MKDDKVTLKTIADSLKISIGTVERAIHGKHDINPDTRKLVLDKINELNYKPNKFARSLSVKNKKKIAVIMPYSSFFWSRVKEGIEYAVNEMSYFGTQVEIVCLNRVETNMVFSYINKFKQEGYDGIILVPFDLSGSRDKLNGFFDDSFSLAFVNDDLPGTKRLFYIGPDNLLIGRLAGELTGKFLQNRGRCLVVSGMGMKSQGLPVEFRQRISGFKSVMAEGFAGIETETVTYEMYTDNAYNAVLNYLKNNSGISSIYSVDGCLNEAAMAVKDLRRRDMVVIGHEISDEVNSLLEEDAVTAAICQNPFLQGYYALKYMNEYLVDKRMPIYDTIYINFNIYTRYNTYGKKNYAGDIRNHP